MKEKHAWLIEKHMPLVEKMAHRYAQRLPNHIDRKELISIGYLELVHCANRYDASKEASFSTFASRRVWGSFQDFVRREIGRGGYRMSMANATCLPEHRSDGGPRREVMDIAPTCEDLLADRDEAHYVMENITFSEREEYIINALHCEISQREIAEQLGITESRVSQLLREIRERMESIQQEALRV